MTGYKVKPDYLDDAAKKLDGLGNAVTSAKNTLSSDGDLPTLDPLSKAMAAAGLVAGGPLGPLFAAGGHFAGKAISGAIDPYPDVRNAWLTALPRYQRLLTRDANELRKTPETYRQKENKGRNRFEGFEPRYPMPRVPGSPTEPMPRVPGSPTVPMPKPNPGTPGNVPI